jgi:hypothetical protein
MQACIATTGGSKSALMCVYVCICVYMYAYMCVYVCIYVYMCAYMCVYMYAYMCVYVCIYIYITHHGHEYIIHRLIRRAWSKHITNGTHMNLI